MKAKQNNFRRFASQVRTRRQVLTILLGLLFYGLTAATAEAHDTRTKGQKVYIPVYSGISFLGGSTFDLAVTLSFRNLDQTSPMIVKSVVYFDTGGKKIKDMLDKPRILAPFATTQVLIKESEFRGDIGANVVVEWEAKAPVTAPLLEAVMVGYRGTQAFAFTSRGVALE